MRLPWNREAPEPLPKAVLTAVAQERDRVLAHAREAGRDAWLVAAGRGLWVVGSDGTVFRSAPWVDIDTAVWQPESVTLTVQWSSGNRAEQWTVEGEWQAFADAVHERVTRSVVLAVDLEQDGTRIGRAAIRRDPVTDDLTPQIAWARGSRPQDSEREAYGQAVLANLCDQVGIRPPD